MSDNYAYVVDLDGEKHPLQATLTKQSEINTNETLSFRILPTKVNMAFIRDITEYWTVVDHDGLEHKVVYFKKRGEGKLLKVDIKAIPVYIDDLKRRRVYERYDQNFTAYAYFNLIFDETPYDFVLVGDFLSSRWEGLGEGNDKASMFSDGLNRYGAEFELIGNTFYLRNRVGRDVNFMYRHRLNASNIVLENDATEFYTYARGYGDYGDGEGGEDWLDAKLIREYTSPLANIPAIGIREAPPIKNGNITTHETMMDRLETLVNKSLKISVTATIHDMREQGYPLAQPRIGDMVPVIDERIDFKEDLRIVTIKEVKNWRGKIIDLDVTFGAPGLSKRHQSNINGAVKNVNDVLSGRKTLSSNMLDNAVAQATRDIHRMQSELTISEIGSLVATDKTDPNNVVVFNAAGLMVSEDGGATAKSAITGLGIAAEVLIGKILIGQNLLIENEKSTFVVDGEGVTLDGGSLNIIDGLPDSQIAGANKWNRQGTYIDSNGIYTGSLTAEQIVAGWNNISRYVKISGTGLETFDGIERTSLLDHRGHRFFKDGRQIGNIGTASWEGDINYRGLSFQLDNDSDYMHWGYRQDPSHDYFTTILSWHKTNAKGDKGLNLNDIVKVTSNDLRVGSNVKIQSSSNAARFGINDRTYIYINENGQVGFVHNGQTYQSFDPY